MKINNQIRDFMTDYIDRRGKTPANVLVDATKIAFPNASAEQIAGNLSALCCYYEELQYVSGMVV